MSIQALQDYFHRKEPHQKAQILIIFTIFIWASAFVGIRAGLAAYSPGAMALLRYLVASVCMALIYFRSPKRKPIALVPAIYAALLGMLGIGFYNVALNYGELHVSAGIASFIIGQAPIFTTLLALLFLGEKISRLGVVGFCISFVGVVLIALAHWGDMSSTISLILIFLATLAGCVFAIMQKSLLGKIDPLGFTACAIWGGTLFLAFFFPDMLREIKTAPFHLTLNVIYLGIFPGALGYFMYSYALSHMPVSQVTVYQYAMPFLTVAMGWVFLGEIPALLSLIGGLVSLLGVVVLKSAANR